MDISSSVSLAHEIDVLSLAETQLSQDLWLTLIETKSASGWEFGATRNAVPRGWTLGQILRSGLPSQDQQFAFLASGESVWRARQGHRQDQRLSLVVISDSGYFCLHMQRSKANAMDIYLPIAGLSVNAILILLLGGAVGILSGMFGVGGGFLTTPLLIFFGIPPTVAAASAATQVTGASVSGMLAHLRRGGVDVRMGIILVCGGIFGSITGAGLFTLLQRAGQIDTVIGLLYVTLLGSIGTLMARDAWTSLRPREGSAPRASKGRHHHPFVAALPFRWRFYRSGLFISPLAPAILGFISGILTVLLGVGGGFIMVPAMIYLLGMPSRVVVGTSLFQILFVTAATTLVHALTTQAVDIVLATILLLGGVTGAQVGAKLATKMPADILRMLLAIIVLAVALRLALGLGWQPSEIYSIEAA
jgi:uncharacterized protein